MKLLTLAGTLGTALLAGTLALAQTPAAKPDEHAGHHPEKAAPAKPKPSAADKGAKAARGCGAGMDCEMMGQGGSGKGGMDHGGMGMMGGGGMTGMCAGLMSGPGKVEVTKLPKGVTISFTSDDPKVVTRVQKMAEAMKLMHEAQAQH